MIGFYARWSGDTLVPQLADRFAASLNVGRSGGVGVRATDGAVFTTTLPDARRARAWQPARTPRGDVVLFDGYLLNPADTHRALGGERGALPDDATLYARAYAHWGDACDVRLNGCYAALIWSEADKTLRLVRSPFKAPALHVWRDDDRLIVASVARAIFATGEVREQIDEQKIADTLFLNYSEGERGWFKNVTRPRIGTQIYINRRTQRTTQYYDPLAVAPIRLKRDEDYVAAADALFEEGARAMLAPFSKPAISVSGGFDSQAVAHYALRVLPPEARLLALTSVPEAGWDGRTSESFFGDERHHVAALAAMYPQIDVDEIDAAGLSFDHKLDAMFLLGGVAPRNAMNLHWIHEVRSRAVARGCDVLLTGAMGNLTFSFDGSGTLPSLFARGHWRTLWREVNASKGEHAFMRRFASGVMMPLLPPALYTKIMLWRHGINEDPFDIWCPLNPDYAREMHVAERASDMAYDPHYRPVSSTRAWRAAVSGNAMNEAGDMQQAMATLHGIPERDPTSYRPLLEFCFAIPDDQYLRGGVSRWLARRMLRGKVPDMVLDETRKGIQAADWHVRLGRERATLRAEIERLEGDATMAHRLDLGKLKAALDDWPAETPIGGPLSQMLNLALPRALATARFIRFVEGRNDG